MGRSRRAPWLPLLALAGALAGACTPPTVSSDAGTSVAQACADVAYARCSHLAACSSWAITARYGSETVCDQGLVAFCVNDFAAPSSGRNVAKAESCAAAVSSWACVDDVVGQNPPPECQTAGGTLGQGASCALNDQCATGRCQFPAGGACGVCGPPVATGDPCSDPADCGSGFSCSSDTKTCAPLVAAGGACGFGMPCLDGLHCVGASGGDAGTLGTCQQSATTPGAACDPAGAQCNNYAGLTCDTQSKQCRTATFGGGGQPCGLVGTGVVYCTAGLCLGSGTSYACQAYAGVGGPCDVASGPGCISPARCVVTGGAGTSGTCAIPDASKCP